METHAKTGAARGVKHVAGGMLDDSHHTMVLIVFEREYEQTAMLLQQRSGDPIIVSADLGLVLVWRCFN